MRLWHYKLIPFLPDRKTSGDPKKSQLNGLHSECCALRGLGWGKKHATVDYVFKHPPIVLYWYHCKVMQEMHRRGYKIEKKWLNCLYRGKKCDMALPGWVGRSDLMRYPEHNDSYMRECIDNLKQKGVKIDY